MRNFFKTAWNLLIKVLDFLNPFITFGLVITFAYKIYTVEDESLNLLYFIALMLVSSKKSKIKIES